MNHDPLIRLDVTDSVRAIQNASRRRQTIKACLNAAVLASILVSILALANDVPVGRIAGMIALAAWAATSIGRILRA